MNLSTKTKKPISDTNVKEVINKDKTAEGVAQETGYSEKTVQKKVKQGKLKLGFTPDTGDKNPPPVESGQAAQQQGTVQLDYYATALGFITFIDTILWLITKMSQGNLEYERLDKEEKEICANALKAEEKVLEILASQEWAMHVIVLLQIVGVFSQKLKIKKKPKKEKKEKPNEPTKDTMKKQALKEVGKEVKKRVEPKQQSVNPMGEATEVSPEVERNEENIQFLESREFGDIDNSDRQQPEFKTPEKHDENYGNPPKNGKGLVKKGD